MKVTAVTGDIVKVAADAIIVNLFEGTKQPGGATAAVDKALGGAVTKMIKSGEIKGKKGEMTLIHTMGKIKAAKVLVIGLGKKEDLSANVIRNTAAEACRYLRKASVKEAATILHGAGAGGIAPEVAAQAITEGAMLGTYTFRKHKSKKDENGDINKLSIVTPDTKALTKLKKGIETGRIMS